MSEERIGPFSSNNMSSQSAQPEVVLHLAQPRDHSDGFRLLVFFAAHFVLALLMSKFSVIATAHALATIAVGFWWAASGERLERVAYIGAYIIGAEVLWRMTGAQIFWETGKYATVAIFIVAIVRNGRLKSPVLPLLYFALLIPSSVMVIADLGWAEARDSISFYLSGPLLLAISAWFFWELKLSRDQLQRLFLALSGPVVGIAAIALYGMMTDPLIAYGFAKGSNYASSGGFGPNQVSSVLGLGALLLLFFVLDEGAEWSRRVLFLCGALWLAAQCALTFSRGGLYNVAVGVALAFPFLIRNSRGRLKFILAVALLLVFANFILLPRLDSFTRGTLSVRFENTDTTGRSDLIATDLQVWEENPMFGVGPGQAEFYRQYEVGRVAAHTEFTRLLAEHGMFGFTALLALLIAGVSCVMRAHSDMSRAVTAALIGWSLFYMLHSAMRVAAPSFIFGLAFASLLYEDNLAYKFILTRRAVEEDDPSLPPIPNAEKAISN